MESKLQNIQIGIDLGTTNSEISINRNGKIESVKNSYGDEYTPSVFGVDKSKNKIVGKKAYEKYFKDCSQEEVQNYKAEVKRLMGTSEVVTFPRLNQSMKAEEVSAEILKSLRADVLRKYPEFFSDAAVVTVPAYFSTVQAEATKRAGLAAGFEYVVLLQEPIAAAIAYGFDNAINENWIVYDLGGGTFDVAVISSKEGALRTLGHGGDNFLGGKDVDWLIVDKIIVPRVTSDFSINEFSRENPTYKGVFAKLKYIAESAKIQLTHSTETTLEVEGIGADSTGKEIYVSINFSREQLDVLLKPLVDRTIELSKAAVKETGVDEKSIGRIILVGGPTQIPYVKNRLEREFGIPVDSSVDPLTVVAKGACIYAMGQRLPEEMLAGKRVAVQGEQKVSLHFDSLTAEVEEAVSGTFDGLKESTEDYYIQIQSDNGLFSGTKIKLRNGKFFDTVSLEKNKTNLFWLYLFDSKGNSVPVAPDSFQVTNGLSVLGAPIPHSIGIAVAKKDIRSGFAVTESMDFLFSKNSILPLKASKTYRTVKKVVKGDKDNALPIKVYEGDSDNPDRNHLVCDLRINGEGLPFDLPANSEVEITITVNESREVSVDAFIPSIDLLLNARASVHAAEVNIEVIQESLSTQTQRLQQVRPTLDDGQREKLDTMAASIQTSIGNSKVDEDEKRKADKQLKEFKIALDQHEAEKELPQLKIEFEEELRSAHSIIEDIGDQREKDANLQRLSTLKAEGEKAIVQADRFMLIRVNEQISELSTKALFSNPAVWAYKLNQIATASHKFINEKEAEYYIQKGKRAIELSDIDEVKRCVHNLMLLLPPDEQASINSSISGITH